VLICGISEIIFLTDFTDLHRWFHTESVLICGISEIYFLTDFRDFHKRDSLGITYVSNSFQT
jgi:hypothetical protein